MTRAPTATAGRRPPDSIRDEVVRILAEQAVLDEGDVRMDSSLEDLGIDSMGLVEAIFAIEERFDIEVPYNANSPEESGFDLSSVESIVRAVEGLIGQQAG